MYAGVKVALRYRGKTALACPTIFDNVHYERNLQTFQILFDIFVLQQNAQRY